MKGIQSPYVYAASPLTSFGFHKEDLDANSINYLHRGKPKVWYFVPLEDSIKLEQCAAKMAIQMDCDSYVRHKNTMIRPSIMRENQINFRRVCNILAFIKEAHISKAIEVKIFTCSIIGNGAFLIKFVNFFKSNSIKFVFISKVVQQEGDFIVTGHCYHSGFNVGYNQAEAINFAGERWLDLGRSFEYCSCP